MIKLLSFFFFIIVLISSSKQVLADYSSKELPQCVVITHCVREEWKSNDVEKLFKRAVEIIENMPRTTIVDMTDFYVHAESKTKWRRYTDDLLVKAIPDREVIQVRSESRVGVGDNGVNKKRVDELAYLLMTNQTPSLKNNP